MVKNFLKGMVIGIANIIPGVSGGTMMVAMNIYDKLIHCITHLFSEFKKAMELLIPIILGMLVAIIASSFVLESLFDNYPLPTNLLFIGLILGGLPAMTKKVKGSKVKIGHIIAFAIFFILVVAMALSGSVNGREAGLSTDFAGICVLLVVGIITAATMVIPGVSGSMVLLLLGYYQPILTEINNFVRALKNLDVAGILYGFKILIPFGIGVLVGIFVIAKIIEWVFKKYPNYAYWAIIGLIVASPIAILLMAKFGVITAGTIIASVITFIIGFFVAMKLGD